jgi:hypothetical protein
MSLITVNEYEHIMNSTDEDFVFDKFFKILGKYIKYFGIANKTKEDFKQNTKYLFNINLKLFNFVKSSDDIDISSKEFDDFRNAYDATKFILECIDKIEDFGKDSILVQKIQIVKSFWDKKNQEQVELGESLKDFSESMQKEEERFKDIFTIKRISSYVSSNLNNLNESMLSKLKEYEEVLNNMLKKCDKNLLLKVTDNLKRDKNYYSNLRKDNILNKNMNDEIFVENIVTSYTMVFSVIKHVENKKQPE